MSSIKASQEAVAALAFPCGGGIELVASVILH